MFYIDQLCTLSFLNGLFKLNLDLLLLDQLKLAQRDERCGSCD